MSGCENPPQDANAMVDESSSLEGSTVTYNCLTGFQENSASYSYVCASGNWTTTGLPCAGEYMIIINPGMWVFLFVYVLDEFIIVTKPCKDELSFIIMM